MKKLFVLFLLLPMVMYYAQSGKNNISGKLLGHNGKPMLRADILWLSNKPGMPYKILKTFSADKEGRFSIPTEQPGLFKLLFCGVDHKQIMVPVLIGHPENVYMEVKLAALPWYDTIKSVKAIVDVNNYDRGKGAVIFEKDSSGIYTAMVETKNDTLAYKLLGLTDGWAGVNGANSDRYYIEEDGSYLSIVTKKDNKKITLKIDPAKLVRSDLTPSIVFSDDNSASKLFYNMFEEFVKYRTAASEEYYRFTTKGGAPEDFKFDWAPFNNKFIKAADSEENLLFRQIYLFAAVLSKSMDSSTAYKIVETIPPGSPLWSFDPNLVYWVIKSTKNESCSWKYILKVVENCNDRQIVLNFIQNALILASAVKDTAEAVTLYNMAINNFPEEPETRNIKVLYNPQRRIKIGNIIPDFTFISIDDSTQIVTPQILKGKVYLLDFWATWCQPCVGEMKYMHEAYEKFREKGFTIIAVSFDGEKSRVSDYRNKKWKMPWFNAIEKYTPDNKTAKLFEIITIPKPILVDSEGRIIALQEELSKENLNKTLEKFLSDRQF